MYERRSGAEIEAGLLLGLSVNGMRVLDRLGLLSVVSGIDHIPTPRLVFYSSTGKRLGEVPIERPA